MYWCRVLPYYINDANVSMLITMWMPIGDHGMMSDDHVRSPRDVCR